MIRSVAGAGTIVPGWDGTKISRPASPTRYGTPGATGPPAARRDTVVTMFVVIVIVLDCSPAMAEARPWTCPADVAAAAPALRISLFRFPSGARAFAARLAVLRISLLTSPR